ncbi:MAG TPA: acetate/propionate family kinase [Azoarcus sp.]|nr:acetate/propionate family kinase [Azoarcus sp.]
MTHDGIILTFNAGSSTIKIGIYEHLANALQLQGRGFIDFRDQPLEFRLKKETGELLKFPLSPVPAEDVTAALEHVFACLAQQYPLEKMRCAGHRVVHGGDVFTGPVRIDSASLARIEKLASLAPLHQPQNVRLIHAVRTLHPTLLQTASFDTAFHTTLDPLARRFALPRALHEQGIKRYGFHGLSFRHIAHTLAQFKLPPDARVVAAHLGSGASLCAMQNGISRDTSMGFSTLDGIPMATRPGALDPGVLLHLMGSMKKTHQEVETLLYRESGLLGVSGLAADIRKLLQSDHPDAVEAVDLFCFRIAGEIARLATTMGGMDTLVFTAGIGEHQPPVRAKVSERLTWLGLTLDAAANARNATVINAPESRIQAFVIPADEELIIANEALNLLHEEDFTD